MFSLANLAIVFVGAGIGGMLRFSLNILAARVAGFADFPWGTFVINITGSLVMGFVAAWLIFRVQEPWSGQTRLFAMTGILGGYTTFSAFSLEAYLLIERGKWLLATAYAGGSVVIGIAALAAGFVVVRSVS